MGQVPDGEGARLLAGPDELPAGTKMFWTAIPVSMSDARFEEHARAAIEGAIRKYCAKQGLDPKYTGMQVPAKTTDVGPKRGLEEWSVHVPGVPQGRRRVKVLLLPMGSEQTACELVGTFAG